MKRILVVYFSQTGQLQRVAESLCAPLAADKDVRLTWLPLAPVKPYPFPWPFLEFFDQFPEAVQGIAPAIQPLDVAEAAEFDLIILAYTVWYLSPAPPVAAFVKSELGRRLLKNRPVVTVIACRNMWLQAHEVMRGWLAEAGARHCDNVVLTDRGSALATFITTPRWMLTGRRDPLWGFPAAGLTDADITATSRFGKALLSALREGRADGRPLLSGLGAASADERLIASERIGRRSFMIWSRLVRLAGPQGAPARKAVLAGYVVFLVAMILTVVPVTMALRALLRPLLAKPLARLKAQYEQPSGSGTERMAENL